MKSALLLCVSALVGLGQPVAVQSVLASSPKQDPDAVSISGYQSDPYYQAKTRKNLAAFHRNFSRQKFEENGNLTNPSIVWEVDGVVTIGTKNFVNGLKAPATVFPGLILVDVYRVVDGDRGAVLYRLQGNQKEEFLGVKPEGRDIDFFQAEFMQFDRNSLLESLQTTSSGETAKKQLLGQLPAGKPAKDDLDRFLVDNPQVPLAFRDTARKLVTEVHENYNIGRNARNRELVAPNVTIAIQSHEQRKGPEAFSDLVDYHAKTFPGLLYHDYGIVTDGRLAAVHWAWQGTHDGDYKALNGTIISATGRTVRSRGYYFYEFGCHSGLVEKVTAVWNELSIEGQINGGPLAP